MLPFSTPRVRSLSLLLLGGLLAAQNPAPAPTPPKGPDKEVAEKIATLKECILDKKCARDAEGVNVVDFLLQKLQGGTLEAKDKAAVVKVFGEVFTGGKVRPHDQTSLYAAAATALGYCGADGAKILKAAYGNKPRFPEKPDWVPFREQLLKYLGRTKDETMVKFLVNEACNNHEAALQKAAGEALGNFEGSKEAIRKEVVADLLVRYGELNQLANETPSIDQQNASDRLSTIKGPWFETLGKLTGKSFDKYNEWQQWYNKHKGQPW
jgi:hypothetical protein